MSTIVLWLSRHPPLKKQVEVLRLKIPDVEIVEHREPLSTADEAVKLIEKYGAQYVIPVLPLSFVVRLVEESKKKNFTVLWTEMELIHNCTEGPACPEYDDSTDSLVRTKDLRTGEEFYRHYRFKKFKVLKDIKFEMEDF